MGKEDFEDTFNEEPPSTPYKVEKVEKTDSEKNYNIRKDKKITKEDNDIAMRSAYLNSLKQQVDGPAKELEPEPIPEHELEPEPEQATEPVDEPKSIKEPQVAPTTPNVSIEDRMLSLEAIIKSMNSEISLIKGTVIEKDEQIEVLTRANIDLILIDMQSLADDANDFKNTLESIGTEGQLNDIQSDEKNHGINMAYKRAMRYRADDRASAREGIPLLTAIMVTMNKFNEKIKYIEES